MSATIMNEITPLQKMAGQMGFAQNDYNRRSSPQVIRMIQKERGDEPCFSTDKRYSCKEQCEWRNDCLKLRAVWLR